MTVTTIESTRVRLRKAMDLRGIKQTDLVQKTGLPKSSISQYLSGSREPKQRAIYLLSEALSVNPAWLMGYDVPMEPDNSEKVKAEITSLFDRMTPEQQRSVLQFLHTMLGDEKG